MASCTWAVAGLLFAAVAESATLRVPEDYPSVLAAVDAAVPGDSVVVGPGEWADVDTRVMVINGQALPITSAAFLKSGLTVVGEAGPAATIVDGSATGRAFTYGDSGAAPVLVEGFTATGVKGVLAFDSSDLELQSCWLVDGVNQGMECIRTDVTLRNCLVANNGFVGGPAAIHATGATVELYDSVIRDNLGDRAVLMKSNTFVVIDGCVVSGHAGIGACRFDMVADLQIRRSTFSDNTAGVGGAIAAVDTFGKIELCSFVRDIASHTAGGVILTRGRVEVANNTFFECSAVQSAALQVIGNDPGVHNNIFAYSRSQLGAVSLSSGTNVPATDCNLFWANAGGDFNPFGNWVAGPNDVFADPLFCDSAGVDLGLDRRSPAATTNAPSCGRIGAFGIECGPVSVDTESWGRIKAHYREEP